MNRVYCKTKPMEILQAAAYVLLLKNMLPELEFWVETEEEY